MAARGDNYITYTYRGGERLDIPLDATHVTVDASVSVILVEAFRGHPSIVEAVFHDKIEKVGRFSFAFCPCLRRVIMPGVEIVEENAFDGCEALTDVECGKLENIKHGAFSNCNSLRSIDLPSAKIVEEGAFGWCEALNEAKCGSKLDRIENLAFSFCPSLERITIPLKDGMMNDDSIFTGCLDLVHVDLVEGAVHETIAALPLEEWRNDMNEEVDTINQILPTVDAGDYDDDGEKSRAIRTWIRSVLHKIIHYQAEHRRLVKEEVATTLQLALPCDIVMNHVLPFLELPSYTFEVGGDQEGDDEEEEEDQEGDDEEEEEGDDDVGRRDITIWQEVFDNTGVKEYAYCLVVEERDAI
eukprot:scaffold211_cov83-Skeletonema_dohrnii-CCMP3373.AAC.3